MTCSAVIELVKENELNSNSATFGTQTELKLVNFPNLFKQAFDW